MKKQAFVFVSLMVILILALSACSALGGAQSTDLKASGTIAAREVNVAPQIGGEVVSVSVEEGAQVKAGDELFRLDDSLLKAQRNIALAGLETAKAAASTAEAAVAAARAQYDLIYSSAMVQDRANRTTDWYKTQSSDFTLPLWYYTQSEQISAAQAAVNRAQSALVKAQGKLDNLTKTSGADLVKAETDLASAQADYQVAKNVNDRISKGVDIDDLTRRQLFLLQRDAYLKANDIEAKWVTPINNINKNLRDEAQSIFDDADSTLKDAQDAYSNALTTDGAKDILKARAQVNIAEERYYTALDYVRVLQTGPESQTVTAALMAQEQAKSAATAAQTTVGQAEANLALIDVQLAKLVVTAPADGVVLTRKLEVGEMLAPGGVVITIGQLQEVELVVYIPETEYGAVHLRDQVTIAVDSFSSETFGGSVVYISDKAEFTPRNVQTAEGRSATVYGIKISVPNPDLKLKPGMPADVTFVTGK